MKTIDILSSNFLENDIISSYLNISEFETYFITIRYKEFSRNEYEKAVELFSSYLQKFKCSSSHHQLNKSIFTYNYERNISIKNIELLGIKDKSLFLDDLSFSEIKSLYKKSAMKYHPDRGGTHEEMKKLNNLLFELHCFVKDKVLSENINQDYCYGLSFKIKKSEDYYILIRYLLFK